MAISEPGRGLVRCLGVTAAALFAFAAASQQRAEALSLASPGTAPSAKFATDGLTTEVQHRGGGGGFRGGGGGGFRGGGGGGFRGGGFHGGGFRGGGAAFHGGGFRGGGAAFRGGGFQRRSCVPWRWVQTRRLCGPSWWRFSRRAGVPRRRHAIRIPPRLSQAALPSPASLPPAVLRAALLRIPVLPWLPAPLLPRDLDLLRAAQDLQVSPVVSPPLARSILRVTVSLLVSCEMKQAPDRAPVFFNTTNAAGSIPILAFPGLDLPRCQLRQPPLCPMFRRPMAEARGLLGRCREIDDARHEAAARLARQLADHIDEFRLVRHGRSLAKALRKGPVCTLPVNAAFRERLAI